MSTHNEDANPFASPMATDNPTVWQQRKSPYPVYCRILFIISLIFAVIRLLMLPMTFIGYRVLSEQGNPMLATVTAEFVAGCGIALGGIVGNGLMLARQKVGLYLGYLLVVSVIASIGVGLWQASFILDQYPEGSAERAGAMVGMAFSLIFRVGLLAAYVLALVKFSQWIKSQSPSQAY